MIFIYGAWKEFCKELSKKGLYSITASDVLNKQCDNPYLVLKHDVETNVKKALRMAQIEAEHGHRGFYYIQAYIIFIKESI